MADLTQEEIDALLRGEDISKPIEAEEDTGELDLSKFDGAEEAAPEPIRTDYANIEVNEEVCENANDYLDVIEMDALGEIGNICMGTSATTMSSILGRKVVITTPTVNIFKPENVLAAYHCPFLVVNVSYVEGIMGQNLLILKDYDAAIITDLMMGGDGTVDESNLVLGELHLSAISEIMNQMIGSSATAMSNMLGRIVNISPPNATYIDADEDITKFLEDNQLVVRISFDMEIEGVLKSKLMQLMSLDLARELVATQIGGPSPSASAPAAEPAPAPAPQPAPAAPAASAPAPAPSAPPPPAPAPRPAPKPAAPPVSVQPVVVPDFGYDAEAQAYKENLDLISDIPLQVTVELGRTKRSLNDVMNFGNGSIVMLDRLAGDAVDIIVNGKPIAKGEVVVIEENYGVRITEMFAASDGNDQ